MSKPITKQDLVQHSFRQLGAPLLEINVTEDQAEDCVEEALQYYHDYHFDGTQKVYLAHQITQEDITNKYLTLSENIISVTNIFDIGNSYSTNNLFNVRYQIALNDLFAFNYGPYAPYYMALQNVALAEELFVGRQSLRFNRHTNKLFIDMSWSEKVSVGEYLIIEGYEALDPDIYTDVYNDRWLKRYVTALIKLQWGANLKKFDGISMPGGVTFSGQRMWDEANQEITALEQEMITSYSLPVSDMIG